MRHRAGLILACLVVVLCACAPEAPPFVVAQKASPYGAALPALVVRRGDGTPLVRDDWRAAEAAARAHCAALGESYARLPPSPDHTQMRLEGGAFSFMARCL